MSDVPTPTPEGAAALLDAPPNPNGHVAEPFEAKLLADLEGAITEKREAVTALEVERAAAVGRIDAQLATQRAALKRYEDTRKRLVGEPLRVNRKPGRPRNEDRVRVVPSKVSPEKMSDIEAFVRAWAEDHEEFRQIDIRSAPGSPVTDSGKSSAAFEQMRQANVLRLARVDGNNKFYRLTRSAVAEQ